MSEHGTPPGALLPFHEAALRAAQAEGEGSDAGAAAGRAEPAPLLAVQGLCKSYRLEAQVVEILHGIDLAVPAGQYLAIMGPSGSGKTSLLEILGAMSGPSGGHYRFDGVEIGDWSDDALAWLRGTEFGFVFQHFNLMPRMSALRNVALPLVYQGVPRAEREARAQALLARMGLAGKTAHRPSQLSGGERQRVALARALANDPRVILADEPTGNLDSKTEADILDLLDELHRDGRTLIVVTHSRAIAGRAERVVQLSDGRIVADSQQG